MAANDLTTLAEAKQYIGISGTGDDGLLQALITRLSEWIQTYLSLDILAADRAEVRDGHGSNTIVVAYYPIISVASVKINGVSIPASSGYAVSGYYFNDFTIKLRGYSFSPGEGNVELAYRAGYEQVPADLSQACLELLALRYKERDRFGISSKNLGPEQVQFVTDAIPKSVMAIFNNYFRRIPL